MKSKSQRIRNSKKIDYRANVYVYIKPFQMCGFLQIAWHIRNEIFVYTCFWSHKWFGCGNNIAQKLVKRTWIHLYYQTISLCTFVLTIINLFCVVTLNRSCWFNQTKSYWRRRYTSNENIYSIYSCDDFNVFRSRFRKVSLWITYEDYFSFVALL